MENLKFSLKKENSYVPWGFGINGGTNFAFPSTIIKINIDSPAFKCGLRANDVILEVNGKSINHLKSAEVAKTIIDSGDSLQLTVRRFNSTDLSD